MNPYTVLRELTLPHCAEGEHEHFSPARDAEGNKLEVVSLGVQPCAHTEGSYLPGQTVHLSDDQADELLAAGAVAPAAATVVATFTVDTPGETAPPL